MTSERRERVQAPRVAKIKWYPVKSLGGLEVDSAYLTKSGLAVGRYKDHEFMLVHAEPDPNGANYFVTQRGDRPENRPLLPQLALVKPVQDSDGLKLTYDGSSLDLPYDRNKGRELTVQIWDGILPGAVDQGDELAKWFGDVAGFPVRLVKAAGSFSRNARQNYMKNDNTLQFQDSYPVHWFSMESVNDLSRRARDTDANASTHSIEWQRFRPQIVVEGVPEPGYEHKILLGKINGIAFKNAKPCDRCRVPLIDQETGEISRKEPTRTLLTYKAWVNRDGKEVLIFGENMLPRAEGEIAVGDPVSFDLFRDPPIQYGVRRAA